MLSDFAVLAGEMKREESPQGLLVSALICLCLMLLGLAILVNFRGIRSDLKTNWARKQGPGAVAWNVFIAIVVATGFLLVGGFLLFHAVRAFVLALGG